jgi:hypothetical protein
MWNDIWEGVEKLNGNRELYEPQSGVSNTTNASIKKRSIERIALVLLVEVQRIALKTTPNTT